MESAGLPITGIPVTKRQKFELIRGQLELEQSTFLAHWRELGNFILPRRPRFFVTDVNRGDRRNQNIIDSTATLAARTLRSGLMSGLTSPARPWFRLTTPDPDLADQMDVKEWLDTVTQRMSTIFLRSNLYNSLPIVYGDIGTFATAAMLVEEDFDDVIRTYPFPIGSYMIGNDDRLKVQIFFRTFRYTVRQMVERFGEEKDRGPGNINWSNFSPLIRTLWDANQREVWVDICHIICPNDEYDPSKVESRYKKFVSCYYERGMTGSGINGFMTPAFDIYLSLKGYDKFPILAPRWEVTGEDVYGTECPGMSALGDIKQLQVGERRAAQAIDKMVNPPMTGPGSLRNKRTTTLPGDVTFVDVYQGQKGFEPAYQIDPKIGELDQKQQQIRERIRRSFYEDLFLLMSSSDRRDITAREVDERHEEKLLALGPVLEQLNQDLLDPLIDLTFDIMVKQGLLPPAPPALSGQPLRVEYVSIMAQAQKLIGTSGLERFAGFVAQAAQTDPNIMDKVDGDKLIEVYGDLTSIAPGIVRDEDQVQAIRDQKQKAADAQQQAENAKNVSVAAKNASQTPVNPTQPTALTALIQQHQMAQVAAGNLSPPK